jgi:hypothetical protein
MPLFNYSHRILIRVKNDDVNFRGAHAAGVLGLAAGQMSFVESRANVFVNPAQNDLTTRLLR